MATWTMTYGWTGQQQGCFAGCQANSLVLLFFIGFSIHVLLRSLKSLRPQTQRFMTGQSKSATSFPVKEHKEMDITSTIPEISWK